MIETCAEQFLVDYIANIKRFFKDVKEGRFEPIVAPPDFTKNEKLPFSTDKKQQTLWRKEYKNKQVDMVLRKELLTKRVKKDYAIGYTSLPHDIREYLLGYKTPQYSAQIIRKFDAQRKDVKQRLKDLNIALDDKGKETPRESKNPDKDRSPRVGEQATWLAEDILHFMPARAYIAPSNGKPHDQKMNNDQFRNLQYSLAYFSSNKADIWLYFKELGLIDGDKALQHPFLFRVDKAKCSLILDFYKAYLIAKDRFLNEAITFIETANKADSLISKADVITKYGNFLPKEEKTGKAKDYADVPVLLPKGLFNEAISLALNKTKKKGYKGEINTVVYNLEQYIAGDTQDFFGYEHHYQMPKIDENTEGSLKLKSDYVAELEAEILKLDEEKAAIVKLHPKKKNQQDKKEAAFQDLKNKLRDTHRLKERILDREQDIRYHQANDRALWLMVKDRQDKADAQPSDKMNEKHLEIELKDLKLAHLEAVLNESVKVRGQVPKSDVQIVEQLPIRRYGDLRRVLKDRRLANLVKYYHPLKEIEHEKIKTEFESYDLRRVRFFEKMYDFEAKVYQLYTHEFPPMVNGVYDYKAFMSRYGKDVKDEWDKIKNYYPHDVFVAIATDHIADKGLIPHYMSHVVQLRNKFLHNEIPYFDWLTKEVENESKPFMSDKIFDVAERYYKDLVRKAKNTEGSLSFIEGFV